MNCYVSLFTPQTYQNFLQSDKSVSGFTDNQLESARVMQKGDKLICYITKIGRWAGVLEVAEGNVFSDATPVFQKLNDIYSWRRKVVPIVLLPLEKAVPIKSEELWSKLSFTRNEVYSKMRWTGKVRRSYTSISNEDASIIESALIESKNAKEEFKLSDEEKAKISTRVVKNIDSKEIEVTIPKSNSDVVTTNNTETTVRESIQIQALLAQIGATMNYKVWVPRSDRGRVVSNWNGELMESLPINFDETTLKTIENIDVIWFKGKSIVRAFEVEHTTSIYSGILRMADLMSLQPNIKIACHIVAPVERREKVFEEIMRPVFALLDGGPLSEKCSYLSYESVREISELQFLNSMNDSVIENFEDFALEN